MVSPQKPPRLREGMMIGIVAPSSPVAESADVARAIAGLERLGFRTVMGDHARDSRGYLAGTDADRAEDLLTMSMRSSACAVATALVACSTPSTRRSGWRDCGNSPIARRRRSSASPTSP